MEKLRSRARPPWIVFSGNWNRKGFNLCCPFVNLF
jgi:hypothetical protein